MTIIYYLCFIQIISLLQITIQLNPIQSGTVFIPTPIPEDTQVFLTSPKHILENAKAIVSITQIDVQEGLNFYFTYTMNPLTSILSIKFHKNLGIVNRLTLDYMIASNIDVVIINMTSFQWHFHWHSNRPDQLLLLLNGFSHLNISGNVTYSFIQGDQMFTIHYMSGDHKGEDWGKNYLLYTAVMMPKIPCEGCLSLQKFHLKDDYILQGQSPIFYGFKGYTGNKFSGGFEKLGSRVIFKFDKKKSNFNQQLDYMQYALVSVPYEKSEILIDKRVHKQNVPITQYYFLIVFWVIFIILVVGLYFWKKKKEININNLNQESELEEKKEPKQQTDQNFKQ